MITDSIRRRAMRLDIKTAHSARKIVAKYTTSIARWNRDVAHLSALSMAGRDTAVVRSRAGALFPLVVAARVELDRDLEQAPDDVRASSLVHDPRRALEHLARTLEELLSGGNPIPGQTMPPRQRSDVEAI